LKERTGNVDENKGKQDSEFGIQDSGREPVPELLSTARLSSLDFGLPRLKEQTGNVYENKEPKAEVQSLKAKVQRPKAKVKGNFYPLPFTLPAFAH
jgi:hypothetical protein